jgi:hypothetical protein
MNFDGKGYCVCEEIIVQIQGVTLIPKAYVERCCQTNYIANWQLSFYKSISILWPLFLVEDLKTNSSRFQGALLFLNFSSCVRLMHCVHLNVWSLNIVSMCCVCDVFLPCLEVLHQFRGTLGLSPSSLSTLTLILSWHLFMTLSLCL